ncbi:MAG: HepT-like ribonuclease domain-containing protein [Victivallaceae bacterium]|jgi:uncharacterized protein with HEPN domain
MSKRSDMAKLELILKYITDLQMIVDRHGSIEATINDMEGEYATMMCIAQIGETVNKIKAPDILSELPASLIIGLRNRLVHDYEEVDKKIISEIIKTHIPDLKKIVTSLIGDVNA